MRVAARLSPAVVLALGVTTILQLVLVNHWPRFESPNERARIYQAIAVADRGALDIDVEIGRFGAMEDVASAGGRAFPNKAPGMLPLLLPGALVARLAAGGSEAELAWAMVLGRLLACSLPFAVAVLLLAGGPARPYPRGTTFAAVALALGSPLLAASLLAFSHALAACLLLAAFLVLHDEERPGPGAALGAGVLLGWAVSAEYPAAVPAVVIAATALLRLGGRGALRLGLGAALPLGLLAGYNAECFGSPFTLSSAHEAHGAYAELAARGAFGIGLPSLAGLVELLVSPSRGLLVWMPALALALWPARCHDHWPRHAAGRLALWLAPAALLVVMSGYANRHGGWFPGPRYLLMVLPLLAVPLARGAEAALARPAGRLLATVTAAWGAVMVWPCLATFPFPPEDYPLPAFTLACPLLRGSGTTAPSWLPDGVVLPLLAILAIVAAAVLVAAATSGARTRERAAALLLAAVPVVLAAALVRPPASWQAALERAVIHDVYTTSTPPGELEALRPRADTDARRARLDAWIAARDASGR